MSPTPHSSPKSNYGSIDNTTIGRTNSSSALNNQDPPGPIPLHPSIISLDVGPHAFRSSVNLQPPPQSLNPQRGSESSGFQPLVRANSHSHSSRHTGSLTSPLLRKFSPTATSDDGHSFMRYGEGPGIPGLNCPDSKIGGTKVAAPSKTDNLTEEQKKNSDSFIYYIIYALVNSIMCVPCLYGYASVIFNHSVFQPHINALSKLVILSSVVHQFCFSTFSSLSFSIGQVQDAGLIFLSAMSNAIATSILAEKGDGASLDDDVVAEVLSSTVVLLGLSTACLGAVLIMMGKFRLADAVAYLPLPVVGGYLAFIGYFCVEAGVSLCISRPIMKPSDWSYLFDKQALLLAIPGIIAGILLTGVARKCQDEAMLPISMVVIPVVFYIVLFACGWSIEDAREGGWVGETSPPVPVQDLFHLIDFGKVRWDLCKEIIPTWLGMVFVVSFSSCLDVAAISMDMGEALDVNNELTTVGISNLVSGLAGGFTGSYIFSQTIFTYRTGCRSRWIGILVAFTFIAVVISTVNFLEVTPLFFLGSTLVFIGFDLIFEWVVEVRHKLLLSEYIVLLATFVAIQFLGINGGIGLGIVVAIFDFVWTTASVSSVKRVSRRSMAFYRPQERSFIENHVYNSQHPKIATLEVSGAVFFGSSMQVLSRILDEAGINISAEEKAEISRLNSPLPHHSNHSRMSSVRIPESMSPSAISPGSKRRLKKDKQNVPKQSTALINRTPPRFLILDLTSVSNVDASAARGCFLQLAKMCAARKIVACAAGANSRIEWIMKTHETAHHLDEEKLADGSMNLLDLSQKIILFDDLNEALQFCEKSLMKETEPSGSTLFKRREDLAPESSSNTPISLSTAFTHFLGIEPQEAAALIDYEKGGNSFHSETLYVAGETIFCSGTNADGFYVVLSGAVVVLVEGKTLLPNDEILSGAGRQQVSNKRRNMLESGQVSRVLSIGNIFGFVDFILQRPRSFSVVATKDALIAKFHRSGLDELKAKNPDLDRIVDKVLLLCSVVELASHDP